MRSYCESSAGQIRVGRVNADEILDGAHVVARIVREYPGSVDRQDLQLCGEMMAMHQTTDQTGEVKCLVHIVLVEEVDQLPSQERECLLMYVGVANSKVAMSLWPVGAAAAVEVAVPVVERVARCCREACAMWGSMRRFRQYRLSHIGEATPVNTAALVHALQEVESVLEVKVYATRRTVSVAETWVQQAPWARAGC